VMTTLPVAPPPPPPSPPLWLLFWNSSRRGARAASCTRCFISDPEYQGLTLVHFSAQPEPFLTKKTTLGTPYYPPIPPKDPLHNP